MIYAVDFDGFLCDDEWPFIGNPHQEVIEHFIRLKKQGHKLILWTCREGYKLEEAITWCHEYGLDFDAHNENLPERIVFYGNDCRKVGADFYCDDKNYSTPILAEDKARLLFSALAKSGNITAKKDNRKAILEDAIQVICNDRQSSYGEPEDNFQRVAIEWANILGEKLKEPLSAYDVGLMMAGLKLVRASGGNPFKRDNLVDLAGYAACAGEIGARKGK